ncbi:MAG: COX15/CtaA family protein [Caulobacteraceae bacterium]
MRSRPYPDQSRAVALWLFAVAVLVFAMVVLGGATRLTGSGLSITEWKPVTGAVPPLSHQAWLAEFQKYQRIPQFRLINPDMTLNGFQAIYWWEWTHRLLGRLVGVAFALPLVVFLAMRKIPRRLIWRCWMLLALGGLQGLVGWWMVASGLSQRVSVAPERLATHLGLALVVFCLLIWTGLEAWSGPGRPSLARRWSEPAAALAALVFVQVILGALVAGNHAGQVFNDWPLMNGRLFPADYLEDSSFGRALLHSQAAVQFNHRLLAYVLMIGSVTAAALAMRSRALIRAGRWIAVAFAVLVVCQASLGITTLMLQAPLGLALAHQCLAAVVLATGLTFAWRVRRA